MMSMKKPLWKALVLSSLLATVGCASGTTAQTDDGEVTQTRSASTDRDFSGVLVSELPEEQQTLFCDRLSEKLVQAEEQYQLERAGCFLTAMMVQQFAGGSDDAEGIALCQEAFDECIADSTGAGPEPVDICPSTEELQNCQVSVGEIETCVDGLLAEGFGPMQALADSTCEDLATPEGQHRIEAVVNALHGMGDELPDIPACAAMETRCPGFFD